MTTNSDLANTVVRWTTGVSRWFIGLAAHALTPPSGWWLLKEMTYDDFIKLIEMSPKQRRYSLQRRQWQAAAGRPIRKYPPSTGRVR